MKALIMPSKAVRLPFFKDNGFSLIVVMSLIISILLGLIIYNYTSIIPALFTSCTLFALGFMYAGQRYDQSPEYQDSIARKRANEREERRLQSILFEIDKLIISTTKNIAGEFQEVAEIGWKYNGRKFSEITTFKVTLHENPELKNDRVMFPSAHFMNTDGENGAIFWGTPTIYRFIDHAKRKRLTCM